MMNTGIERDILEIKKIKVAICVPSLIVGGAERMVAQLFNNISRRKFEVLLIVNSKNSYGIVERSLKQDHVIFTNKEKVGFDIRYIKKFNDIFNKFKPSVIHTNMSVFVYVIPWAVKNHIKVVHTIHSTAAYELHGLNRLLMKFMYHFNFFTPIAISDTIAQETATLYSLREDQVEIIYNPVDTIRFHSVTKNFSKKFITFIYVGRIIDLKNVDQIVRAFFGLHRIMPNTRLLIVGDGELREKIVNQINDLYLNDYVLLPGNVENVENWLAKADIFVQASSTEGLPIVILEAMAAGLPVIATNIGGISDIVKDNGILFSPGDEKALFNAMLSIANNRKIRRFMSEQSLKRVKKYDITKITQQYATLYIKYAK